MIEILLSAVVVGLVTFTVARSLVYDFENEDNNNGPFKVPGIYVQPAQGGTTRGGNLFDAFRLFFGLYTVEHIGKSQFWRPKESYALGVWACRHCLGFWIAVVVTLVSIPGSFIERLLVVFGAASINTLCISVEVIANGTSMREMQRTGWDQAEEPEPVPEP